MRSTSHFRSGLKKLESLWKPGRFGKALILVDQLLSEWPDNPLLLVRRAQLIQLQESEDGPSLEEARATLERAADLDEESPRTWIELGFFCFAVEDDAAAAGEWFGKAEQQMSSILKECRKGKKAALAELRESGHTNGTPKRNRSVRYAD